MSDEERAGDAQGAGADPTEQAGETTAADMVHGPEDTRPVGADTMVKVAETSESKERR